MTAGPLVNAFTVDLEDWFQGLEIDPERWPGFEPRLQVGTGRLLELLARAGVRATFFVLGHAAARAPGLVRAIRAAGHEVGTHGYAHRFAYRLGPEAFAADLRRALRELEDLLGEPVRGHRAAFFSITRQSPWAFEVLRQHGIRFDASVFPVRNYRYGVHDAPRGIHWAAPGLAEFPATVLRVLRTNIPAAGGAYFRILPYRVTHLALARANAAGQPASFYIHPWELDPEQPRLERLPRRIGLPHYANLRAVPDRLERLLRDFRFAPMGEVLAARGWLA